MKVEEKGKKEGVSEAMREEREKKWKGVVKEGRKIVNKSLFIFFYFFYTFFFLCFKMLEYCRIGDELHLKTIGMTVLLLDCLLIPIACSFMMLVMIEAV
jgi:hypothetical protein